MGDTFKIEGGQVVHCSNNQIHNYSREGFI
jgi:hypothetical protein